jgi:hypothetical protein
MSEARNQPLAPFWILFCPGLGYYSADGEARKAAVFLRSDFHREIESISSSDESANPRSLPTGLRYWRSMAAYLVRVVQFARPHGGSRALPRGLSSALSAMIGFFAPTSRLFIPRDAPRCQAAQGLGGSPLRAPKGISN